MPRLKVHILCSESRTYRSAATLLAVRLLEHPILSVGSNSRPISFLKQLTLPPFFRANNYRLANLPSSSLSMMNGRAPRPLPR